MTTLIDGLRQVVGTPSFSTVVDGVTVWNYNAILEYFFSCVLLCIVVSSVFRLVVGWFNR